MQNTVTHTSKNDTFYFTQASRAHHDQGTSKISSCINYCFCNIAIFDMSFNIIAIHFHDRTGIFKNCPGFIFMFLFEGNSRFSPNKIGNRLNTMQEMKRFFAWNYLS